VEKVQGFEGSWEILTKENKKKKLYPKEKKASGKMGGSIEGVPLGGEKKKQKG